jgi:hypothetical protein
MAGRHPAILAGSARAGLLRSTSRAEEIDKECCVNSHSVSVPLSC